MKTWELLEAIGEADERMVQAAELPARRKSGVRLAALVAAMVLALAVSVTALATVSEPVNELLYRIWPFAAQSLKPVALSCEDQGIRMEVLSVAVEGQETLVTLTMQDLTGDRLDETVDLFDTGNLLLPYDGSGTCMLADYDAAEKKATFAVYMRFDTERIGDAKATFRVSKLLSNKRECTLDLTPYLALPLAEAETVRVPKLRGWGGSADHHEAAAMQVLDPAASREIELTEGVTFTGAGLVDGALHVQLRYGDIIRTDNHGFLYLTDGAGNILELPGDGITGLSWFGENGDSWQEYIFDPLPLPMEELKLMGEFVTADPALEGDWQVTFPLVPEGEN